MSEVLLNREGHVAVITLAAPERRNALTAGMVDELMAICEEVDADETIGAAVVQAQGQSFCSGAHRDLLRAAGTDPARQEHFSALGMAYRAFVRVGELRVPTVAAVRGHAVGAGVNLMLATDLRVMANEARVITGFAAIGIHPGGGHFALMGRLAGREATAALSLFGQEIDGRRAAEIGLAWVAVPADEVEGHALAIAQNAAADPELSRQAVRSFRLELGPPALPWPAALEVERGIQMWSLRRRETRESG